MDIHSKFMEDLAAGNAIEDAVLQAITEKGIPARKTREAGQHLGDIVILPKSKKEEDCVFVEVKADFMAERTGNLYLELAECYTQQYRSKHVQKAGLTELVGLFKHATTTQETVVVHQIGEGDVFAVYNARVFLSWVTQAPEARTILSGSDGRDKSKVAAIVPEFIATAKEWQADGVKAAAAERGIVLVPANRIVDAIRLLATRKTQVPTHKALERRFESLTDGLGAKYTPFVGNTVQVRK